MEKASLDKIPETKRPLQARGIKGNTQMWLKQMSARDTVLWGLQDPLWIIENKAYDLTDFAIKHPGGESWITMTKGQDITALFITHHLDEAKVRNMLSDYYRYDTPIQHQNRFDFTSSGHYTEIRSRILAKYSIFQLKDTKLTEFRCYLLTLLWFVLLSACGYLQSYVLSIVSGCFMMIFQGIGHLFIHRKDGNLLRHTFLLIGFSARQQQIMHAISHHPYTNTMLDYEYAAVQDIMHFARCLPTGRWYSAILLQILFLLIGPSNVLTKLLVVPILNKESVSWQHLVFPLQILYLYLFAGDFYVAFKLWAVMILVYGFVFGKMVLCPHRQIQLWSEGAPEIRDYVLHTIATTCDTCHSNVSAYTSLMPCTICIQLSTIACCPHAIIYFWSTVNKKDQKQWQMTVCSSATRTCGNSKLADNHSTSANS